MKKNKLILILCILLLSLMMTYNVLADSTFEQMKKDVGHGGWEVIWSESYGVGDAAALTACVYFGCAQSYLGYRLDKLKEKVGKQWIEQALRNKGKVMFGPGKLNIQAGDAYWSVYHTIWNPLRNRHEKITTERYVRLYVKYKRESGDHLPPDDGIYENGLVGIFSENREWRLDIGDGAMKQAVPANHDSWATRFVIKRLDGESVGAVSDEHVVGIFSENGQYRLDIGDGAMKRNTPATHNSWATRLKIRRLNGESKSPIQYGDVVGVFSENGEFRLDIGDQATYKNVSASQDSWATRLRILPQ